MFLFCALYIFVMLKRSNSMDGMKGLPMLKCLQPTAGPNRAQRAYKYTYVIEGDSWDSEECLIKIAERPFAAGGMRWCIRANRMDNSSDLYTRSVVKIFKPDVVPKRLVKLLECNPSISLANSEISVNSQEEKAYFHEAITQTLAECYAKAFNQRYLCHFEKYVRLSFLPVSVLHLVENDQLVILPPFETQICISKG